MNHSASACMYRHCDKCKSCLGGRTGQEQEGKVSCQLCFAVNEKRFKRLGGFTDSYITMTTATTTNDPIYYQRLNG